MMRDRKSHCHTVAGDQLRRVLRHSAEKAGCLVTFVSEESRAWRSATFDGGYHRFVISGTSVDNRFEDWLTAMLANPPALRGFIVAEASLQSARAYKRGTRIVTIEVMTVVDA